MNMLVLIIEKKQNAYQDYYSQKKIFQKLKKKMKIMIGMMITIIKMKMRIKLKFRMN